MLRWFHALMPKEERFFELLRLARKGIGELVALQERAVA